MSGRLRAAVCVSRHRFVLRHAVVTLSRGHDAHLLRLLFEIARVDKGQQIGDPPPRGPADTNRLRQITGLRQAPHAPLGDSQHSGCVAGADEADFDMVFYLHGIYSG